MRGCTSDQQSLGMSFKKVIITGKFPKRNMKRNAVCRNVRGGLWGEWQVNMQNVDKNAKVIIIYSLNPTE
jgi:hypothetical protein